MTLENKDCIKGVIYIFAILFFVWVITAYGKDEPLPQTLDDALRYGCKVLQVKDGAVRWKTIVYIDYKESHWEAIYSIRDDRQEGKSLDDCKRWIKFIKKEFTRHGKST